MQTTARVLKADVRAVAERVLAFASSVDAMLTELRTDETTLRIRALPDPDRRS